MPQIAPRPTATTATGASAAAGLLVGVLQVEESFGNARSGVGVRCVTVCPDLIGILLVEQRATHHDPHLVAEAGVPILDLTSEETVRFRQPMRI